MSKLCDNQEIRGKFHAELFAIIQQDLHHSDVTVAEEQGERKMLMPPQSLTPLIF